MKSLRAVIENFNLIGKGDVIGCAVSGGSDSMALLHFMRVLKGEIDFKLVCVNVEHGIRGEQSKVDTQFVREYCRSAGIEFLGHSADVPAYAAENKHTIEQAAREIRYGFFYGLIESGECGKIFVAHNKNDNAESVLLHLFRGSGVRGMTGMSVDSGRGIYRPCLYTDKAEILQYIFDNGIPYVEDATNADTAYSRNYLRREIIPIIEKRFKGATDSVLRLAEILGKEDAFLDGLAEKCVTAEKGGYKVILPCDEVLLKRAVMMCCRRLGAESDILSAHINAAAELALGKNGNQIDLSNGITVCKDYDGLIIGKKPQGAEGESVDGCLEIPLRLGAVTFGGYVIDIRQADMAEIPKFSERDKGANREKSALYADGDKLSGGIIRFRRQGDIFKRCGGRTKLLSDFFTDIKLSRKERSACPLICRGSAVLAVIPIDISDDVKIEDGTSTVYKITFYRR